MNAFIDTDILIWHLRGERKALHFLQKLHDNVEYGLFTGAMQRTEIVFFMRPEEKLDTELFLSQFKTVPVNEHIIDLAGTLFRKWHPSHGIDVNDAILAATVLHTGGKIYCLNKKHYPMPKVLIQKAW